MKLIVISLVLVVLGLYYYSGRLRYRKRCLKVFARLDPILVSTEAKYARRFMPASLRHLLYVEPVNLGLLEGVRKASSEADLAALIARADELAACIEMLVNDAYFSLQTNDDTKWILEREGTLTESCLQYLEHLAGSNGRQQRFRYKMQQSVFQANTQAGELAAFTDMVRQALQKPGQYSESEQVDLALADLLLRNADAVFSGIALCLWYLNCQDDQLYSFSDSFKRYLQVMRAEYSDFEPHLMSRALKASGFADSVVDVYAEQTVTVSLPHVDRLLEQAALRLDFLTGGKKDDRVVVAADD